VLLFIYVLLRKSLKAIVLAVGVAVAEMYTSERAFTSASPLIRKVKIIACRASTSA